MTNVLTWAPGGALAVGSRRLAALQASHHAMWNYVTYRDAIALVGGNADELYPEGTTRLPDDWADLGWLTCFHGPPASALKAITFAQITGQTIARVRLKALAKPKDSPASCPKGTTCL